MVFFFCTNLMLHFTFENIKQLTILRRLKFEICYENKRRRASCAFELRWWWWRTKSDDDRALFSPSSWRRLKTAVSWEVQQVLSLPSHIRCLHKLLVFPSSLRWFTGRDEFFNFTEVFTTLICSAIHLTRPVVCQASFCNFRWLLDFIT